MIEKIPEHITRMCTSKTAYNTEEIATDGAFAVWKSSIDAPMMRPYECPHCGKWHLSRSKKLHSF